MRTAPRRRRPRPRRFRPSDSTTGSARAQPPRNLAIREEVLQRLRARRARAGACDRPRASERTVSSCASRPASSERLVGGRDPACAPPVGPRSQASSQLPNRQRPGTASSPAPGRGLAVGPEPEQSVLARRPARPVRGRAQPFLRAPPAPRSPQLGRSERERRRRRPPPPAGAGRDGEARRQLSEPRGLDHGRLPPGPDALDRLVDRALEHFRLLGELLEGREEVRVRRRMDPTEGRQDVEPQPVSRESRSRFVSSSLQASPAARQ